MIAYLSILFTAFLALAGMPIYFVLFGTLILLWISLAEQRKLNPRFATIGASYILTMAAWQSAVEALLTSSIAFLVGLIFRTILLSL